MPPRPSLQRERAAWAEETLLVGVDEAGRGPLAGPVVAAAVVFPPDCRAVRGLRDSKILPARVRRVLADRIRARALALRASAPRRRTRSTGSTSGWPRPSPCAAPSPRCSADAVLSGRPYRILIDGLPLPGGRLPARRPGGRRRPLPVHRGRRDPRQDDARPAHGAAGPTPPGLRVADQRGLRHGRASRRAPRCTAPPAITG